MARGDRSRPERTREERERGRLERERRRAERAGEPLPPQLPEDGAADADADFASPQPDVASPQPDPADPLALDELPRADPPDAALEPPAAAPLEPVPEPPENDSSPAVEVPEPSEASAQPTEQHLEPPIDGEPSEAAAVEQPETAPLDAPAPPEAEAFEPPPPDPYATQGYEIPGLPPDEPAPARSTGLPAPPPRVSAPRGRKGRRVSAGAAAAVAPGGSGGGQARRGRGSGARLAALVALAGVAVVVVLLVHSLKGSSGTRTTVATPAVRVLIPEGKTRVQIAQIAKAAGLKGSYRSAAHRSDLLNPVRYGAPRSTPDLEGFLFPATYDMNRGAPASRLVEEQLTAFQENFGAEDVSRAKALGVTPYQLLTVASMIEREAQVPGDRAKIAAVIYNRLKAGMPLGIDASIYYAVEMQKGIATYTHELTESQLHIASPYNTRLHTGLPPTPISNPGAASIQAAAHPTHAAYLYYVAGADGCGEQVFSDTLAAFEANASAYEAAKQKNGGRPPTCKHK